MKTALIVGAGPQGRIVVEILQAQGGWDRMEFIDDNPALWGKLLNGVPVTGGIASLQARQRDAIGAVVALGNPVVRLRIARQLDDMGIPFLNAIHPGAVVSPSARIGEGVTIEPFAYVAANAVLGNHIPVMVGSVIGHDAAVADGATVAGCVAVGGRVRIGRGAFICVRANILARVVIGEGSVVAAGSLVGRDVPPGVLVFGVPARKMEEVGPDFDWGRLL
jgi:sugar O-acyltransferase (sialic acid O-acetyltransferase NeuD family)